MVRVLFVCLGNICRSPMAEAIFQHKVKAAGLADQIMLDSAGTSSYHEGESAHSGTLKVLGKNNIPYDGRSRPLLPQDFYNFDYLLAMDNQNLRDLNRLKPADSTAEIALFLDYAEGMDVAEVPDPYYNGGFEGVYRLVEEGAAGLLKHIIQEHQLK